MRTNCCNEGCSLPSSDNQNEVLLEQIKREVKKLLETTEARLLCQSKKINETMVYIKNNLSNAIRDLLDSMQNSGELDDLITNTILDEINNLENSLNNLVVYYGDEIYTESLYDEESSTHYYVTHVPTHDTKNNPIRFKLGIANNDLSFSSLESPLEFADETNSTLVINAGYYNVNTYKPFAGLIQNGRIIYEGILPSSDYNFVAIDRNNRLKSYPINTSLETMINDGVELAFCGKQKLIVNNTTQTLLDNERHPRQAIGQKSDCSYIIITCDGRHRDDEGMTYADLVRLFYSYGCENAYALDGGGSSSTVLRGVKQNKNMDDNFTDDRKVSNFLYIKKTVTYEENQVINDSFKELGKVKQDLLERIINFCDVEKGWLRLRGRTGFFFPGIEYYSDGSDTRLGKSGMTNAEGLPLSWYATLLNPETGTDSTVIRATWEGLYNCNGLMANLLAYTPRVPDGECNIKGVPMSMYYMYEYDLNSPGEGQGASLLLHIPFTSDLTKNIRQICIPLNENRGIKMRACNSSGNWTNWYELGVMKGNTASRPTNVKSGAMYFDTTLGIPIWYDGTNWINASGTSV